MFGARFSCLRSIGTCCMRANLCIHGQWHTSVSGVFWQLSHVMEWIYKQSHEHWCFDTTALRVACSTRHPRIRKTRGVNIASSWYQTSIAPLHSHPLNILDYLLVFYSTSDKQFKITFVFFSTSTFIDYTMIFSHRINSLIPLIKWNCFILLNMVVKMSICHYLRLIRCHSSTLNHPAQKA